MPSSSPVQKGTPLLIGFGSLTYTGFIPEDGMKWENDADEHTTTDTNGAMINKMLMNPRQNYTMDLIILSSGGTTTPPKKGDTITITNPSGTSVAAYVNKAPLTFARSYAKLNIDIVKEDSMTYT